MRNRVIPTREALDLIDDREGLAKLSTVSQGRIFNRLDWVEKITSAPHGEKEKLKLEAARALNVSLPTVGRFVRAYRRHGWSGLCDKRGKNMSPMPCAFRDFVRQLHFHCQRETTGREVHRMLVERWRQWKKTGDDRHAIPGYDSPPPAGPKGYPVGWSEDNVRRFRPDAYSLAMARQGGKTAGAYLASILKTRVGTKFGQVVFFDDQDYDIKVAARGTSQRALRPQGFNSIDYLSGCFMHHSIRLRTWDPDSEQYKALTKMDFTWFVISYLQRHGYRNDSVGTTFVFEHGTASGYCNKTLSTFGGHHDLDDALAAVSHGCIRVVRSGLFNSPAYAGMLFRPQSSGNPKFKSPLESMFNLVRNRMAALPGATGRNRDLKPEEQYGVDHYTGQMLKLHDELDERHRKLIRFPMLTAEQLAELSGALYDAINARTDHQLEGWEKCGFVAPQFRFTPDERSPWLSNEEVMELTDDVQAMLLAKAETPGHVRTYRISPADVAKQCAGELTKLPDHAIPFLIPRQWSRPATVRDDREIWIKDQLLGPEAFRYVCRIEESDGSARTLQPGMKVLCYLNPYAPERLVICKEDGAYWGTLQLRTRAGFTDQAAILDQLKERAAMKADMDAGVRPHLEGLMADRAEMKRHNDRLKAGKPVLPDEVAAARAESARQGTRTRKANEVSAALGAAGLSAANLLPSDDDADDEQEPCKPAANPFDPSLLLKNTPYDHE